MRHPPVDCTCRSCGVVFKYSYSGVAKGRGQFCSPKCSAAMRAGRHDRATPPAQRYERFVIRRGPEECWGWAGFKYRGYGRIRVTGAESRAVGAHRVSYEIAHGAIPEGMTVLHRCDNPECTNPAHLRLGTNAENNADRNAKGRQARGESHSRAKLTEDQVREIRASNDNVRDLAGKYGLTVSGMKAVLTGHSWKHILPALLAGVFLCQGAIARDGDTWICRDGTHVRAWGIDAPELQTAAGPPSRNAAARLINGQTLTCEKRGTSFDRTVALCRLPDGRDVGGEMIKQHQAVEWEKFSRGYYRGIGR